MPRRIKKIVEIDVEITPEQCAQFFALSDTHYQAAFLNELGRLAECHGEAEGLKPAWWEFQLEAIRRDEGVPEISDDAKTALTNLQDYICNNPICEPNE